MRRLAAAEPDPWSRSLPLHFTASALVVHPGSGRVLLRWHQRLRMWLQAGGHADPGERDPLAIALREAREETGLPDLTPWPDGTIRHAVVCQVPAGKGEPAHEHADLRYLLSTRNPDAARPERPDAPLRWLAIPAARELVGANNLRHTLDLVQELLLLPDSSNVHLAVPSAVPAAVTLRTQRPVPVPDCSTVVTSRTGRCRFGVNRLLFCKFFADCVKPVKPLGRPPSAEASPVRPGNWTTSP
ncbi:MAG: NUDIX domain-containing protein [Actinobacteria bacterium]|nr:NUDIX domain-containing protein [Actinomycetota bacterium]